MRPGVVVFMVPLAELPLKFIQRPERDTKVELFFAGSVAPLDLPVALGAAPGDVLVSDAHVVQVPREVGAELRAKDSLDSLDGHRQAVPELLDEVDRGLNRIVRVELHDAVPGGLIRTVNW